LPHIKWVLKQCDLSVKLEPSDNLSKPHKPHYKRRDGRNTTLHAERQVS
jgi:hypothetical protein